jgi:hypothetical protein
MQVMLSAAHCEWLEAVHTTCYFCTYASIPQGLCCTDHSVAAASDAARHSAGYRQRLPILQKAVNFGVGFFQQGRQ